MSIDFEAERLPRLITKNDPMTTREHHGSTESETTLPATEDDKQARLDITEFIEVIKSENNDTLLPLCRDSRAPDVFFIPEDILFDSSKTAEPTASRIHREAIAKQICKLCKVQTQCLEIVYSLDPDVYDTSGIWGGLTEQERKNHMRRPRVKSA